MKRITIVSMFVAVAVAAVAASAQAAGSAPVNTSAPVVSGQPYVGKKLATTTGSWENNPTGFSYQWVRCDQTGNNCAQISGATATSYTPTSADVNHTLASWVTATNSAGTAGPVTSKPTSAITPALPPTNTSPPLVVGKPLVGEKLLADPGKYSGGAVETFTYQWQTCQPSALVCADIGNATSQSYAVANADLGQRLRFKVTATNPFGKTTTTSAPTVAVTTPVVTVQTTLTASAASTICCQRVHLNGQTSPAKAGEQITVLGHEFDAIASTPVATTTTDANGAWSVTVTPAIQTDYTAQTSTSTSRAVTVVVHPRVGFGVNGNTFSAKVTARDSFAGSVAWFQMLTGGGWHRIALVVINPLSIAKFHVHLRRGHTYTLRIYLPQQQAGPGYLNGTSHSQRVGGVS